MKVLLFEPGADWATADVAAGLKHGLEAHGVEVVAYPLNHMIARSQSWLHFNWRKAKRIWAETQQLLREAPIKPNDADIFMQAGRDALFAALWHDVDVVLSVSSMFFHPDIAVVMRRAGLRVVSLFTESPYDLEKELNFARLIDGCWTNERTSVEAFRRVNANTGYVPHGWHPERHKPGPQPEDAEVPAHDVVFVGSAFHERVEWLSAIDWTGIDLALYGSWNIGSRHRLRQYVRGHQVNNRVTASLYRRAKIGLNLYRTSKGWGRFAPAIDHAESLNPRAYELAACGAFHLSTYRAELGEVFGDLVPTLSASPHESGELIRRWLALPEERARLARALPESVATASWTHRAQTVIGDLQLLLRTKVA